MPATGAHYSRRRAVVAAVRTRYRAAMRSAPALHRLAKGCASLDDAPEVLGPHYPPRRIDLDDHDVDAPSRVVRALRAEVVLGSAQDALLLACRNRLLGTHHAAGPTRTHLDEHDLTTIPGHE